MIAARTALALLPLLATFTPSASADESPLRGRWVFKNDKIVMTLTLGPGEYTLEARGEAGSAVQSGKFAVLDGKLIFKQAGQENTTTYTYLLANGSLTVSGGDLAQPITFVPDNGGGVGSPTNPVAAPKPPAGGDARMVGKWVFQNETIKVVGTFGPDGRYWAEVIAGGVSTPQHGRYAIKGDTITFAAVGAEAVTYPLALNGDTAEVTTPELGKMTYRRIAGSEKTVIDEIARGDAARKMEDDEWRAQFPIGPMGAQPRHFAIGEVPEDRNVSRIFPNPTVFTKGTLYVYDSRETYVHRNGNPPGTYKTNMHWHFLPTGRIYVQAITYLGAVRPRELQRGPWATYYIDKTIDKSGFGRYDVKSEDEVVIEMDTGEKMTMSLIDGRRNLLWGTSVYGEVRWELEALRRFQEKK